MTLEERIWPISIRDDVAVWGLDLAAPLEAAKEAQWLSAEERLRAEGFRDGELRARFELRRGLARLVLAAALGVGAAEVPLVADGQSAPSLDGWFVSLADSFEVGLVGLARFPVGVDLEHVREFEFEGVLRDHFSPSEALAVRGSVQPIRTFFEGWTRKEACAKAAGVGIGRSLGRFAGFGPSEFEGRTYQSLNFDPGRAGYVAALAWIGQSGFAK
jgi:4'-phosphopantetheinyl transferase